MKIKGIAAFVAVGMFYIVGANAAETRGAMTISAYVAVASNIDVKTASVETAPPPAAKKSRAGACAAVALICSGPSSMRVTLQADGATVESAEGAISATPRSDLCNTSILGQRAAQSDNQIFLCGNGDDAASNVLGVTIDY